jgi:hypothetical protein
MDWIAALSGFSQDQISGACSQYMRQEPKRRPTPADIRVFILETRGNSETQTGRGDRNSLTRDEAQLLYEKVLPAARRMLTIPGLREHAEKTLAYWGERP